MKPLDLEQGSPEWHAHRNRKNSRNASNAPALMGVSKYMSREDLIDLMASGIQPEIDEATQKLFDRGHELEPAIRAFGERVLGIDFYPTVATSDDDYLSASFDGVSITETVILEAKQPNQAKMKSMREGIFPMEDWWQVVQQFGVNESAEKCIYIVGDGTDDNTEHMIVVRDAGVDADIVKLRSAWAQADVDVANWKPKTARAQVVGDAPESLPAVVLRVDGQLSVMSNFEAFEVAAKDFLENKLIKEPKTDQDFADLDKQIKEMKRAEEALDTAETQMLAQIEAVDFALKSKNRLHSLIRDNRLMAEKLLAAKKQQRKTEIIDGAQNQILAHYETLNANLEVKLQVPDTRGPLTTALSGLRSIKSFEDAVGQVVANSKINASSEAERHRRNLTVLDEAGRAELFGDRESLVRSKFPEDLRNLAKARIADADAKEADRLQKERERIRKEEADKLAAAAVVQTPAPTPAPVQTEAPAEFPAETASAPAVATPTSSNDATPQKAASGTPTLAKIQLGHINAMIFPLTITADGLTKLGFPPVEIEKSAKLYNVVDLPRIIIAMGKHLRVQLDAITTRTAA